MHTSSSLTVQSFTRTLGLLIMALVIVGLAGAQTLTEPRGGEIYKAQTSQHITWNAPGQQLGCDVSYDGGNTWIGVGNLNSTGRQSVRYKDTTSDQCYVRIFTQDATTGAKSVIEQSPSPFTVWSNTGVKFTINGITAATRWHQDSTVQISWTTEGATQWAPDSIIVSVYPDSNTKATQIIRPLAGSNTVMNWKVWRRPADGVRVQIQTADKNFTTSSITPYFTITGATVNWGRPSTSTYMVVGVPDTIRWDFTDIADGPIKLEFNALGGTPNAWVVVDSTIPKTARMYAWTPTREATLAQFRLTYDSGYVKSYSPKFAINTTGVDESPLLPTVTLDQNFPNPFSAAANNSTTVIPFTLSRSAEIGLRVFDMLGRTVTQTPRTFFGAGRNELMFDASSLTPGVYGYQLLGTTMQRLMLYTR